VKGKEEIEKINSTCSCKTGTLCRDIFPPSSSTKFLISSLLMFGLDNNWSGERRSREWIRLLDVVGWPKIGRFCWAIPLGAWLGRRYLVASWSYR